MGKTKTIKAISVSMDMLDMSSVLANSNSKRPLICTANSNIWIRVVHIVAGTLIFVFYSLAILIGTQ